MPKFPFSVTSSLLGVSSHVDALYCAFQDGNRVAIVRECGEIMSFLSDILNDVIPEDASIIVK